LVQTAVSQGLGDVVSGAFDRLVPKGVEVGLGRALASHCDDLKGDDGADP
jgi:hypothetical protein